MRADSEFESALTQLDQLLEPYRSRIGSDYERYRNHCARVIFFSRELCPTNRWSGALFATAAAFHDIGLWTKGDWDYLGPSCDELRSRDASSPELESMILNHHKLTSVGSSGSEVTEIFRRADVTEVTMGFVSFGIPRARIQEALARFPRKGFIAMLVRRFLHRLATRPCSPLPMFRL